MLDREFTRKRVKELNDAINEWRSISKVSERIMEEYMEDDKGVIHVNVQDLYNPLSMGKFRSMDDAIFDYIEECANILPALVPLKIVFHGADQDAREEIPVMYKRHYHLDMQDHFWDQRENNARIMYMTILGLVLIVLYLVLAISESGTLFLEILSIIGSFALCDAVGCFLIQRRMVHEEMLDTAQFLTAELEFSDETE